MSNSDSLDSFLHFGCLITLSYSQNSFVHSDGFIDESLYVTDYNEIEDFSQAIFRVLPQCMHTIQNDLVEESLKEGSQINEKFISTEDKLKGELKDNLETYENSKGSFIRFGSIVYLQHVQTHRFLTIIPDGRSTADKDSLKVCLTDFPTDFSYIKLESSFNFQKEGKGYIRKVDMVLLEVSLKTKTASISLSENYIRVFSGKRKSRELNACLDKKLKWQINLYMSVNLENSKLIISSDYIWISHSEGKAVLVASHKDTHSHVYFHTNLDNCNGLWEIENSDFRGGSFVFTDRSYRIKHLSSSLYLSLDLTENNVYTPKLSDIKHPNNLWKFKQVHSKKNTSKILSEQFYSLVNEKFKVKLQALEQENCILLGFKKDSSESSYLKVIRADSNSLWESQFTKGCIPLLKSLSPFIADYRSKFVGDPITLIKDFKQKMKITKKCLIDIKKFLKNKLQSTLTIDKHYGIIDKLRQKSVKELGIIDILANTLDSIFIDEFGINKLLAIPKKRDEKQNIIFLKNSEKLDAKKEFHLILLKILARRTQMIYKVIKTTCKDNIENQLYVFRFFEIFQKHAGYDLGATKCLTSLLMNNESLLYKVHSSNNMNIYYKNTSIIDHYIWLLKKFSIDRKPHLVEFLKVVCVFNELGVAVSQEKVHENMFYYPDSYNKLIIPTSTDSDKKNLLILLKHRSGVGEDYVQFLEYFSAGRIVDYEKDLLYFTELIGVFSALCKGRNYICKESINNWFPLPFLLDSIWNTDLTTRLRANFLELLISMHIDFQPRNYIQKPDLIRTLQVKTEEMFRVHYNEKHSFVILDKGLDIIQGVRKNIKQRRKETSKENSSRRGPDPGVNDSGCFYITDEEYHMFSLKCNLIIELERMEPKEFNEFSLQLLKLANILIQFEVITIEKSELESRRCYVNFPNGVELGEIDIYRVFTAIQKLFFIETADSPRVTLLNKTENLLLSKNLIPSKRNKDSNYDISEEPFVNYLEGMQKFLQFQSQKHIRLENLNSYKIKCKLEFCNIIHLCLNLRQEYLINNFMDWYVNAESHSIEKIEELLPISIKSQKRPEKIKPDWHQSSIDPLMYLNQNIIGFIIKMFSTTTNYMLKSELIEIILKIFSQKRYLIKHLKQVKLMSMEYDPDIVLWCKINISTLRSLSEQSEIICKYWTQSSLVSERNAEKLDTLTELIKNFGSILYADCKLEEDKLIYSGNKIDESRQIMLKNLNLHVYISGLIKNGMYLLEEIYENPKNNKEEEAKRRITVLFKECFQCLKKFTLNNQRNQKALFHFLDVFSSNLRIQIGQIDLLCDIFRDNSELCGLLTESFLQQFINLIITEGRQADFLNFFEVVTEVKGVGIPNIQRIVLMLLTNSEYENIICYMNADKKFEFCEKNNPQNPTYKDQPFVYHTKLISVLTKCGTSNNSFQLTKAKCQKIIPLLHVFEFLSKSADYTQLEIYLLEFLLKIYITPVINEDVETYFPEIEKLIDIKTKQLTDEISSKNVNLKKLEKWVEFLNSFDSNFSGKNDNTHNHKGNIIKRYISKITDNWEFFKHFTFTRVFKKALRDICERNSMDINDFIINDEPLEMFTRYTTEKQEKWEDLLRLLDDTKIKTLIKEEGHEFLEVINNISDTDNNLTTGHIIESLVEFVSMASIFRPPLMVLHSVIKFLAHYIPNIENDQEKMKKKAEIQEMLRQCRIVPIVLDLMCDKTLDKKIFAILVVLSIKLLEGGNNNVQQDFYNYFSLYSKSENFFYRLNSIVREHISLFSLNKENTMLNLSALKKSNKLVNGIIKLLQLFCENHFELLQNYIRVQEKSHNNYDLVQTVILLLHELMRSRRKEDFFIISHCFGMLSECIQGPCRQNQKALIDSKFLEISGGLLSINEDTEKLEVYDKLKNSKDEVNEPGSEKEEQKIELLKRWMISHLKYKCMITIIGILEGQMDNNILIRMARTFNLQIFRQNLISIYMKFQASSKNLKYSKELFYHYKDYHKYNMNSTSNKQDNEPEYYTFVIEIGFLIFFLLKFFIKTDDTEVKKLLENDLPEFIELNKRLKETYSNVHIKQKIKFGNFEVSNDFDDHKIVAQALGFFEDNTGNAEIVFQGVLCVTYFWLPPVCHHLTYETQEEFHSHVDRSSDKKKVEYLVVRANEIIEDMSYEEFLSTIWGYKLIGKNLRNLKFIAFILSIFLNLFILLSYNRIEDSSTAFSEPNFGKFENSSTEVWTVGKTQTFIFSLGIIQAILSGLIFFFFIIKTAPILIQRLWKRQESGSGNVSSTTLSQKILLTILYTLLNPDVVYHFFYFSFSILAITLHPFFYSAHLLDIMYRFPSLQGVVKSIVVPWRQLLLTFIFIIVIIYLFGVWAFFRLQSSFGYLCNSLLLCVINVFDKGIKCSGGIGMWLDYLVPNLETYQEIPEELKRQPGDVDLERFFYDNLFTIILLFIMLNIIQGIIYVTFAVVREIDANNLNDIENICFVCGKEKEIVERLTERPFSYHRLLEHNEWNYIFFIAYLMFKEETELSGIESYVFDMNSQKKSNWIPQQQCTSFNIKEKQEENTLIEGIRNSNEMLEKFERTLKVIRKGLSEENS